MKYKFDAVVIGGGIAGLATALKISEKCTVAVVSKVHVTRSHSVAAQGGIAASLGNEEKDSWEWHMFDTIKGGDYLVDQNAARILSFDAPSCISLLEKLGVPFNRNSQGRIQQRRFGGHTKNFGESPIKRACFVSDRTGRAIMDSLYDEMLIRKIPIFNEIYIQKLIFSESQCCGIVGYYLEDCSSIVFHSKAVIIATGGAGRIFDTTSNGFLSTGDGFGLILKSGLKLEDMEFIQFHPTGIYGLGILVSEAARAEGGILKNSKNVRFMKNYAPKLMELAPRDIIARAIFSEINSGRGINGKNFVYLDLTSIKKEELEKKIPEVTSFVETYLGFSPSDKPIPVAPTCHYFMGGIPTTVDGQVLRNKNEIIEGLFAVGECACVSIHGANRLGCNSLIDLIVFGLRTGKAVSKYSKEKKFKKLLSNIEKENSKEIDQILEKRGKNSVFDIQNELQKLMSDKCGIFRDKENLSKALIEISNLRKKFLNIRLKNKKKIFNYELQTAFELNNMLETAKV